VDALLDDPVFFAPFAAFFDPRQGRPSIPMETYLRLMFLKFRYRLGYETLCREVTDSISWQRFARIPLGTRVPHPTTLMKNTTKCGDATVAALNDALLAKAASALFQVVSQRYLKTSIAVTTNPGVGAWGEILGDTTVRRRHVRPAPAPLRRAQPRRRLLPTPRPPRTSRTAALHHHRNPPTANLITATGWGISTSTAGELQRAPSRVLRRAGYGQEPRPRSRDADASIRRPGGLGKITAALLPQRQR
jgi:IS5 family transposase